MAGEQGLVLPLEEKVKLIAYVQRNKKDMTDLQERAHKQVSRPLVFPFHGKEETGPRFALPKHIRPIRDDL
jgi:hypothetical protein